MTDHTNQDDGGPAFPVPEMTGGMSLRDYFAAAALQGELAQSSEGPWRDTQFTVIAERCYLADAAMIA